MSSTVPSDLLLRRLEQWEVKLREAHAEFVELAKVDAQKSGHKAEGIWVEVAQELLPPTFRVLSRKYIGPEVDIVVLPPTAPRFYDGAEVSDIPADIACAIVQVKNTLDRGELRDAMQRIHAMNSGPPRYMASKAKELNDCPPRWLRSVAAGLRSSIQRARPLGSCCRSNLRSIRARFPASSARPTGTS